MTSATGEQAAVVPKPPIDSSDAAWVSIPTPLTTAALAEVCQAVEALYRLNPYYTFSKFNQTGPTSWYAEFENHSNQANLQVNLEVSQGAASGISVQYDQGIKKRTVFTIEPAASGSTLMLVDDYEGLTATEREQRLGEVDKSLAAWGEALRVYCLRLKRWSWLPGWQWYIRRLWLPMKPASRRIVWWLYLISLAEFFFFLFVMLIYLIEQART
jgi:hypothetical protein